ncbi:MAG: vanadium-dependent haloperoxidase [Pyrinomonadaceae bacterium]
MREKSPAKAFHRRRFLRYLGAAAKVTTGVAAFGFGPASVLSALLQTKQRLSPAQRSQRAAQVRQDAAEANMRASATDRAHLTNGDEERYSRKFASYSKGLKHLGNGEVEPSAYQSMIAALDSGDPADFDAIEVGGDRKLTNPQAGLAYELEGGDTQAFVQPPPPAFASRELAAEIAENYWMALLRDVPFARYDAHPTADAAARDLTQYGADAGVAKNATGSVVPGLLFRGLTAGDAIGPYLSQFFYQPCRFGANDLERKMHTALPGDFMTAFNEGPGNWLDVQSGISPPHKINLNPVPRYMRNGRDLAQWVHVDVLFQAYFQSLLILLGTGAPLDANNPYARSRTQMGFGTFGEPHIFSLMCKVAACALHAVWFQKWFVHRRLRPEVFAARIHRTAYYGVAYPVHPEILNDIATLSRLGGYMTPGNALLPMAYPEGSPTHPSYGAGHATVAGACTTILKAWFDESHVIPNPLEVADDGLSIKPYTGAQLTVGGELDKIASNVAMGRNVAGVHWRSDATQSLLMGEAIAIHFLKEQKACFNEPFKGFTLTTFGGTTQII